jgi:hypothetical protein
MELAGAGCPGKFIKKYVYAVIYMLIHQGIDIYMAYKLWRKRIIFFIQILS